MAETRDDMATVRDCFAGAQAKDWDAMAGTLDPDYLIHPEGARGAEGLRALVERYHAAIGGLRVTIDDQFTDGDQVVTRWTARGRHEGEAFGAAATGRDVEFTGITVSRFRDGRIVEEWELCDIPGLMAQIGAIPEAAPA